MSKLTSKQEKFCQEFTINGGNATAAYRSAYNAKDMKEATINVKASLFLKQDKIRKRIVELQAPIAKIYDITREFITSKVMKVVEFAEQQDPTSFAPNHPELLLKSSMELSKLHGLNVEKTPVGINLNMTSDSIAQRGISKVDQILAKVLERLKDK